MKLLRSAVSVLLVIWLAGGYAVSQWFTLQGRAMEWAIRIDQAQVQMLSLVLFVLVIILAFVPDDSSAETRSLEP